MKDINTFLEFLTNIEQVFDESIYVTGEEILDSGNLILKDQNKNLFNFEILEGEAITEVDIKLTSAKLNKHSCSCALAKSKKICPHIIGSYLMLRKYLLNQEQKPKKKIVLTRAKSKTIRELLTRVSKEDLVAFIQKYSKKDKKFSTATRVHFLSQQTNVDEDNIKSILDKIISPARTSDKKVSISDWTLLFRTLEDFHDQAKDAINLSRFKFASNIISSSLLKIYYALTIFNGKEEQLLDYATKYTALTKMLFEKIEAPMAKATQAKKYLEICSKSYFKTFISYDILHVLLEQDLLNLKVKNQICKALEKQEYEVELRKVHSLSLQARIYQKDSTQLTELFNKMPKGLISKVLDEIYDEDDFECLETILKTENITLDGNLDLELRYKLALQKKDYKKVFKNLLKLLEKSKKLEYYLAFKSLYPTYYGDIELQKMIDIILKWPIRYQIDYFLLEKDFNKVCLIIKDAKDVDLCIHYDNQIPDEFDAQIAEAYHAVIAEYLENHVGYLSGQHINKILNHIKIYKSRWLYSEVSAKLVENYGDRKSIKALVYNA